MALVETASPWELLAHVAQFVANFAQKPWLPPSFSRVFRSGSGLRSM
jgi:hypothetical protein